MADFREFPPVLKQLLKYARRRRAASGTVIFEKGDPGSVLYAISSGTVKIARPPVDGREATFNLLHQGDVFGEFALLDREAPLVARFWRTGPETDCGL
jgi:CRP/FNR family cyclic AMP-dependent transcriptional regulator